LFLVTSVKVIFVNVIFYDLHRDMIIAPDIFL